MSLDPTKAKRPWVMPWQQGWVTTVAWLDKNRVAAGNQFGQILVFQVPDELPEKEAIDKGTKDEYNALPLKPERLLLAHTNEIGDLAVTADGKLVSCSYDHTLRVWDLSADPERTEKIELYDERGKQRAQKAGRTAEEIAPVEVPVQTANQEIKGHNPEWIRRLDITPDRKKLLSGDDSGLAILWDTTTWSEITRVKGDVGWIRGLALSPDAKLAITTNYAIRYSYFDSHIRLWNLETGEESLELEKAASAGNRNVAPINAATFSPDGKLVALGKGGEDGGGALYLVDLASKKQLHQMKGHAYGSTNVRFTSDGKYLVSAGRDTLIAFWQVADGKQVHTLGQGRGGQFKDWIHDFDFTPDETRLAAADMAGMVHVWDFT